MNKKKQIDWIGVENEYRAGQLSIREIGRIFRVSYEAIRKRATAEKWERDLADRVRKEINKKLVDNLTVDTQVDNPHASEDEIISQASDRGVEVILSHRKDIARLREIERSLLAELYGVDEDGKPKPSTRLYITQYQGDIVEKEVSLSVAERAGALRDLAKVQQIRITLERQAYNLNEEPPADPNDKSKGFVYEHLLAAIIFERNRVKVSETKELTDGNPAP